MLLKLQQNFDVIRFLVNNASTEQLNWRKDKQGLSLGEIVQHLYLMEIWHQACLQPLLRQIQAQQTVSLASDPQPDAFTDNRQRTLFMLNFINAPPNQHQVMHKYFGKVSLSELLEKINVQDQNYIHQIEELIHHMPLNPQMARARHEIRDYHQRYQTYLTPATSLLDIGVGPGLALQYIMQQNTHLTFEGVDVRDLRLSNMDVPLRVYKGKRLPFEAKQFDVSLLFYVLHHCHDPQQLLSEAVRVSRQHLILIEEFDQPGGDSISLDLTERQNHRALGLPTDLPYQLFDKTDFEEMLKKHSLTKLEQQILPSKTTRPVQKYLYVLKICTLS